jgi:hypothetical protein
MSNFEWSQIDSISRFDLQLQNDWPPLILALLLLGILAFAVASYHWEGPSPRRKLLTALRTLLFGTMLVILLQPAVELTYEEAGESVVVALLDESESMSVSGEQYEANEAVAADAVLGGGTSGSSRAQLAVALLGDESKGIAGSLSGDHELELFRFAGDATMVYELAQLSGSDAKGDATAIGTSLDSVTKQLDNRNVSAVVLLSDMAWNAGKDPSGLSRKLGNRGVPIFPVPIGQTEPADVAVTSLQVRDRLFPSESVPLKVNLRTAPQLAGESTELSVWLDDKQVANQVVRLEAGSQTVEIPFMGHAKTGAAKLDVRVQPFPGEITTANNAVTRPLTFIDQKVNVLYVEGSPRWEYRYLRWVLLRDPRLNVKFLMTQGDPDLAAQSPEYLSAFPASGSADASKLDFDLVIVGDVPADYFDSRQLEWMTAQVQRRGGSLIMLGGAVSNPQSYAGTPLAPLLPVTVTGKNWLPAPNDWVPHPVEAAISNKIAAIGESPSQTRNLWKQLAPLYELPPVAAKPGANVLITVSNQQANGQPFPLVAWHRYGNGKSMFVGTELLWRLRKKTGRHYHERFWSTAIQFMATSRLLGGNSRVTIETEASRYPVGETVRIYADVLNDFLDPSELPNYQVVVRSVDDPDSEQKLTLTPATGAKGLYQGFHLPREPGTYEILANANDRSEANVARFEIYRESLEMRDPAMRADVAHQLAAFSGGKVVRFSELSKLPEWINQRRPDREREISIQLWDHPLLYLLLLAFAGTEWWLRRRERLV